LGLAKLMKEQQALSMNNLVSPLLKKHGYTFHSILDIAEDSAVKRVQSSEGDLVLKFLAHPERGHHEAEILLELQDNPHIVKLINYFQANCGKYGYVLVFQLYQCAMQFKPTSPTELKNFMFQLFQVHLSIPLLIIHRPSTSVTRRVLFIVILRLL